MSPLSFFRYLQKISLTSRQHGIHHTCCTEWSTVTLCVLKPFGFIVPKDLYIIWHANILALSAPDEGYSRNASCAPNLISSLLYLYIYI